MIVGFRRKLVAWKTLRLGRKLGVGKRDFILSGGLAAIDRCKLWGFVFLVDCDSWGITNVLISNTTSRKHSLFFLDQLLILFLQDLQATLTLFFFNDPSLFQELFELSFVLVKN